jgi:hypothetical protein
MAELGKIEKAAPALCRHHGVPEATTFEGKPMWMSYIPEVKAVLQAALSPKEYERLLGHGGER